jgi:hypothetical protein
MPARLTLATLLTDALILPLLATTTTNVQMIIVTPLMDVRLLLWFVTIIMNVLSTRASLKLVAITQPFPAMMAIFAQRIPAALLLVVYTLPLFVSQTEIVLPKLAILPSGVKLRISVATTIIPVLMMDAIQTPVAGTQT